MKIKLIITLAILLSFSTIYANNSTEITLPDPSYESSFSIEKALYERRSIRSYDNTTSLALQEISQLLWAAYGVTKPYEKPVFLRGGLKTAPSAGALYPLEIYLVAWNVDELEAGIYKYFPENHSLILTIEGDKKNQLSSAAWNQTWMEGAASAIVYSAVYSRTTDKYGSRGQDRYVCMDLGHSAQNVYLQGVALGIGTCAVGAFNDKAIKKLLTLPDEETPLYIMPIGKIKE
ncbi:MAG TPA: SagB/ThcOx family dehydrogenase [Candidatus Cloacimonetes bacterium]|nr:SagB/ThcOx family dehydrogenase [Candidatus Cloacimonadota bacterium]HEX37540.1 SagB/ThcOx family dehydrogenase [Candidatus Cloacimonadota bacterium]